jgi:hypothetical protein
MSTVARIVGHYSGSGTWHDSAGQTGNYQVAQDIRETPNGFEVAFKHRFDDGKITDSRFEMRWVASRLFRVEADGKPVGHGYWLGDYCHYHLEPGGRFVEAGYLVHGNGLKAYGSSSRNADGNYVAWHEELHRRDAERAERP